MKKFLPKKQNKGFVILYAIIVASIVLSVAFGVSNIALKEVNFSTSAKDTNDAFYAADSGIECATMNDKTTGTSFLKNGSSGKVTCGGNIINMTGTYAPPGWAFDVVYPNSSCAKVTVLKDETDPMNIVTRIAAKGYNVGGAGGLCSLVNHQTEREIRVTY